MYARSLRRHVAATLLAASSVATLVVPPVASADAGEARAGCTVPIASLPGDRSPTPVSTAARPALGESSVDTAHGTCVVRLTDHRDSRAGGFARTIYSRSQAFSADGSRVLVYFRDGSWHTVDRRTSADLGRVPGIVGAGAEPQWDALDPALLHFLDDGGGPTLRTVNVRTGRVTVAAEFGARLGIDGATRVTSGSSGSPSADQRWWAFAALDTGGRARGIVVWDRDADRIVARLDFAARGLPPTDTVSMSPSGDHVVAEWPAPTGVRVFPRDLSGPGAKINAKGEHGDLARLPDGRDAYVSIDFSSTGWVYYVDLDAALADPDTFGAGRVELFHGYPDGSIHSIHFSGKAFDRPGWVLASTYDPRREPDGAPRWLHARLIAIELAPGGRTVGIAHARVRPLRDGEGKIYFAEPHASANRDFTAVVWNSNWESDDALDVDAYLVDGLDWGDGASGGGEEPCAPRALRHAVAPDRWELLGLPCRVPPGTSVAALFGDDVDGEPGEGWTLFRFDPARGEYVEALGADPAPPPGEGFWFLHTSGERRTLTLPADSVRAEAVRGGPCRGDDGCVEVVLDADDAAVPWRLASSPVDVPVAVGAVRVATRDGRCSGAAGCTLARAVDAGALAAPPLRFDGAPGGGYVALGAADTLPPWEGLWVAAGGAARGATLRVPRGR